MHRLHARSGGQHLLLPIALGLVLTLTGALGVLIARVDRPPSGAATTSDAPFRLTSAAALRYWEAASSSAGRSREAVPARLRPARIAIPSIGLDATVGRLGLNPDLTVEVPSDFARAGWYEGSAAPGRPGAAVILGHLDSHTGPAVFFRLPDLRPGARIVLTRAGGGVVRYSVVRVVRFPKDAFPTRRVYGRTSRPVLRLVTCGGMFDRATGHYLDNVIVFAELVPPPPVPRDPR